MKHLSKKDMEILNVLSQYPQGLFLIQVQKFAHIEKKEYAFYYLKKLTGKGYVRKQDKLYFAASRDTISIVDVSHHITHSLGKPSPIQRPHAEQLNFAMFRTSRDSAQATLNALHIPYNLNPDFPGQLDLVWKGLAMRITTQCKLLAYPKADNAPFNVPWEGLREILAIEACAVIEDLLAKTGLQCLRDPVTRELLFSFGYGENAYPGNEIAQKDVGKGMVIYAYDLATGKKRAWGDGSLGQMLRELETNNPSLDAKIKRMFQGMQNEQYDPFADHIRTRQDLEGIKGVLAEQNKFFVKHNQLIEEIRLGLQEQRKMTKKLNERLSQRSLGEFL